MEESADFRPLAHLSGKGNEARRRALESDDLRIWDLAFLAGRISVKEGAPRYYYDGITPGIEMGVLPDRLIANQQKSQGPQNT